MLAFGYPESFDRQLGDRVTKRLKSPRARVCAPGAGSTGAGDSAGHASTTRSILRERIAVLDGSWGVLIQRELRGEEAYRGERFRDHPHDVAGDPDLLNITRPEVVSADPQRLLRRPAPTSRRRTPSRRRRSARPTTRFGADVVHEMNVEGARLARRAADDWTARTPDKPRFVAGAVGPLNVTLSLSPQGRRPGVPRRHVRRGARRVRAPDRARCARAASICCSSRPSSTR